MKLPVKQIRVVAASPVEAGDRRLLPSVLVTTMRTSHSQKGSSGGGEAVRLRPVSIVVEGTESAEWMEIPNTTANIVNQMAATAATMALVGLLVIAVSRLLRH
jgi:hypothetical protein